MFPDIQMLAGIRWGTYLNKSSGNSSLASAGTKPFLLNSSHDGLSILGLVLVQARQSSGIEFASVSLRGESKGSGDAQGEGSEDSGELHVVVRCLEAKERNIMSVLMLGAWKNER